MDNEFSKKYYKIGEVAEILDIPVSTLRFWESEFTVIKPRRNDRGTRFYTPDDIRKIRMIHYLVKDKGLKLDAAQRMLQSNRDGVDRRADVVMRLQDMRQCVQNLLDALSVRHLPK